MANQKIVTIDNDNVVIQNGLDAYYATYEQYLNDGGLAMPDGLISVEFNEYGGKEKLYHDGDKALRKNAIKDFITQVLASSHNLSSRYTNRLRDESVAAAAINLDLQRKQGEKAFMDSQNAMSLDAVKEQALSFFKKDAKLYTAYQNNKVYFISHLGYRFNGDQRSLDTLRNLYETFERQQLMDGRIQYLDYDNEYRSLSKSDIQMLILESQANLFKLFKDIQAFKSSIKEAPDKAAVYENTADYTFKAFTYVPSDFSKVDLLRSDLTV